MLTPSMGGPSQRIARLGDRWSLQITARAMYGDQGSAFMSALEMGLSDKVRIAVPQLFAPAAAPGAVVSGSGQAGRSLVIRGLPPGYSVRQGQWVNVITGGVHYLHRVTAPWTADGTGTMSLALNPMLRAPPMDGDAIEIAAPVIEGFIDGSSQSHSVSLNGGVTVTISITEAE